MVCSLVPESVSSKKENFLKWPLFYATVNSGRALEGISTLWPVLVRNYSPRKASSTYTHTPTHTLLGCTSLPFHLCFFFFFLNLKSIELSLWDFCHIWLLLYLCISLIEKENVYVCMYLNLKHVCRTACLYKWKSDRPCLYGCLGVPEVAWQVLLTFTRRHSGPFGIFCIYMKWYLENSFIRSRSVHQRVELFELSITTAQGKVNLISHFLR